ncbi:MAG TPA: type II CAAX endopeptidase family protein [Candidatus Bathyarchaeia archaeon]|nr:type II CAAX endopeptidase family protein [Candidatus Bathyarchaeia archaeon]
MTRHSEGQSAKEPSRLRQMMRHHPLFFFFFLAYAFSWIIATPYVLSSWGLLPRGGGIALLLFTFLKAYAGPTLAAIIMTSITAGKPGLRGLRHRLTQWRSGWQWYLFILVGIPALLLLGIIIQPGLLARFEGFRPILLVYPVAFFAVFLQTGLPEEIGWRGFALPRMQPRYGPLRGTLLLGVMWGFWYSLYFLTPDHGGGPDTSFSTVFTSFLIFLMMVIAITIIMTWVFNHTQGSVFIASLLHTSINTPQIVWIPLFRPVNETTLDLANLIAFGVPALLIVILTRGRLGYQTQE